MHWFCIVIAFSIKTFAPIDQKYAKRFLILQQLLLHFVRINFRALT